MIEQDNDASATLFSLLTHPDLISASSKFKSTPVCQLEGTRLTGIRHVYVFQREYATVDPERVDVISRLFFFFSFFKCCFFFLVKCCFHIVICEQFVGTDEATTCVGIAIRYSSNGRLGLYFF